MRSTRLAVGLLISILVSALLLSTQAQSVLAGVTNTPSPTPSPTGPTATPQPGGTPPPPGQINLTITKSASVSIINVGTLVDFTITVTNLNPNPVSNVAAYDPLPAEVSFISAGCSQGDAFYDPSGRVVNFNLLTLAAGASATCTVRVRVNDNVQPPNAVVNTAILTSSGIVIQTSNQVTLRTVPGELPQTGFGPQTDVGLTALLAVLAMSLPLGAWWLYRRRRSLR